MVGLQLPSVFSTLWLTDSRSLAHLVIVRMPLKTLLVPILFPTFYLWIVDTIALRRGTWVIEQETKLGYELWPGLEIE